MISYIEGQNKFNFRVGAIILDESKKRILLHRIANYDFWILPGGRVEMLEDTKNTAEREIKEELGVDYKVMSLSIISENFFNFDNKIYHELAFNYIMEKDGKCELYKGDDEFIGVEGEKYRYKWFDISNLNEVTIRPKLLTDSLMNLDRDMVHIIYDERINI